MQTKTSQNCSRCKKELTQENSNIKNGRILKTCKICNDYNKNNLNKYLLEDSNRLRNSINRRLNEELKDIFKTDTRKNNKYKDYLGCDINEYMNYLKTTFLQGCDFDNHSCLWEIDHILPLNEKGITIEEKIKRFHYSNTRCYYLEANQRKGNRTSLREAERTEEL